MTPHEMGAKTALVALVDTTASQTTDPTEFQRWAAGLAPKIGLLTVEGNREFLHRRIRDWTLYLDIRSGHVPTSAELAEASHWMQRILAEESTSPPILALLAETGRTRKIRNIATNRASRQSRDGGTT